MMGDGLQAKVYCKKCKGFHPMNDIEVLDIEEDYCGRDKVTFNCPEDKNKYSGLVVVSY
tara:strand:- start:537 stop:713 length:177 start_codon:yes stop_codon:yes gene_type:complete